VLRLVDCSLLAPPQAGLDGRYRYVMLETLRAYGARLAAEAGEQAAAAGSLARYAVSVAEDASAGMQASTGSWRRFACWTLRMPPCARCSPGRKTTTLPWRCG
jgi:hypothetical protein